MGSTCKVSVIQGDEPALVQSSTGNYNVPSAVFIGEEETIIGEDAVAYRALEPHRFHQLDTREIGTDRTYEIAGSEYTPEDIIGILARNLISDVNNVLGEQVSGATIACPSWLGIERRAAIRDAVTRGGLPEANLIAEPLAACLGYGIDTDERGGSEILVYDMGHRSFDATIVKITEQGFKIVRVDGDSTLGGKPIEDQLYDYVKYYISEQSEIESFSEIEKAEIRSEIQHAKEELSEVEQIVVPLYIQGEAIPVEIDRDRFEELIDDMVRESVAIIDNLIEAAPTEKSAIDEILLVGGTTRIPLVRQRLEEYFGIEPTIVGDPTELVAKGVAIAADQYGPDDTRVL